MQQMYLKHWQYIFSQCKKRNISVICSFGADGDSCLLRAMKISPTYKVKTADVSHFQLSPSYLTTAIPNPKQLMDLVLALEVYSCVETIGNSSSRKFLAGSHHLKSLLTTFT